MNKKGPSEGRDNIVRDRILRFLFDQRHRRTKGYKTTEIEQALKPEGFKAGEIRANLPYLMDNEWVVREEFDRSIRTQRGTTRNVKETRYRISAKGIDLINGMGSPYSQNKGKYAGIHIEHVSGTVILGDQNVVSQQAVEVVRPLDQLARALEESPELSDGEKHDFLSELASLRAAVTKRQPNRKVVAAVVEALEPLANLATIASFVQNLFSALRGTGLL